MQTGYAKLAVLMVCFLLISAPARIAAACAPVPSGLIAWWPGDANATDSVMKHPGAFEGNTGLAVGKAGLAFSFDGDADSILVGASRDFLLPNFTIEGWLKRANLTHISSSGTIGGIASMGYAGFGFWLEADGKLGFGANYTWSGSRIATSHGITDTNWHHVAVTRQGQVLAIYIDGALQFTTNNYDHAFWFGDDLHIGAVTEYDGSLLGMVDELSLYNRALSAAEVQSIFAAAEAGKCAGPVLPRPPTEIVNAGFEAPPVGTSIFGTVLSANDPPPGWTIESASGGTVGIHRPPGPTAEGLQFLDPTGYVPSTIYQDIWTDPGRSYRLRFAYGGHPEWSSPGTLTGFHVFWNRALIANLYVDTVGKSPTNMGWRYFEAIVPAASLKSRLLFKGFTGRGGAIDDVTIMPADQAPPPPRAVAWLDDQIPAGAWTAADPGDAWNWVTNNPTPWSGTRAHQSNPGLGIRAHYFSDASPSTTMTVSPGDTLITWVFLNPTNPPREIMLRWRADNSWDHGAYWGAKLIPWSADGSPAQQPMGALPRSGEWAKLEVPASLVNLEGRTVTGMNFVLYDGQVTWDYSGKRTTSVPPPPVVPWTVSVVASDPIAYEKTPAPPARPDFGKFTFSRSGDASAPLTISFTVAGTARHGTDYRSIPNFVTFPAGVTTVDLALEPIGDAEIEGPETVNLLLSPSAAYTLETAYRGTVTIGDTLVISQFHRLVENDGFHQSRWLVHGEINRNYTLQMSTNLVDWTDHLTVENVEGTFQITTWTHPEDSPPRNFFRVIRSPAPRYW
jgi:hypothetical protein